MIETITDNGTRFHMLDAIARRTKDTARVEASILTTYSINFQFYENVLLRQFQRAGSRLNLLMVDARQLAEAMVDPYTRPRRAGHDYILAPITTSGAFHPKVLALLADKRPLLAVGSNNTTDSGFAKNLEVITCWGHDGAGVPRDAMLDAIDFVMAWLDTCSGLDQTAADEIRDRLHQLCPADGSSQHARFIGWYPGAPSLLDQMKSLVLGNPIRVLAMGPFFDRDLRFIRETVNTWRPSQYTIAIQPATASFPGLSALSDAMRVIDASVLPSSSSIQHKDRLPTTNYLHAKVLAVETDKGLWLALGSANPSAPAWLQQNDAKNAEAVVVLSGETAAETYERLGLTVLHDAPCLPSADIEAIETRKTDHNDDGRRPVGNLRIAMIDDHRISLPGVDAAACRRAIDLADQEREISATFSPVSDGAEMVVAGSLGTIIRIDGDAGPLTTVILHSMPRIRAATRPHSSSRILDKLGCIDDMDADLDGIISVLDHYIFTEDNAAKPEIRRVRAPISTPPDGAAPFGPRGVSIASIGSAGGRGARIVSFELSEIISLLIRDLTDVKIGDGDLSPLDPDDGGDAHAEDDAEETQQIALSVNWNHLVTACRKRIGSLLAKLRSKLTQPIESPERAAWLFGRLLLTLSLIRNLRNRQPFGLLASRRGKPDSLVSIDQVRLAYKTAMEAMYRDKDGVAAHLEGSADHRLATERVTFDALLLWAAMEIGADAEAKPTFGEEREERARRLSDKADVIVAAMSAAAHPDSAASPLARAPARSWRDSVEQAGEDWWDRHLAIGAALQASLRAGMPQPDPHRAPAEGDIVVWMQEPGFPRVVASAPGHKVSLFGLGTDDRKACLRLAAAAVTPISFNACFGPREQARS